MIFVGPYGSDVYRATDDEGFRALFKPSKTKGRKTTPAATLSMLCQKQKSASTKLGPSSFESYFWCAFNGCNGALQYPNPDFIFCQKLGPSLGNKTDFQDFGYWKAPLLRLKPLRKDISNELGPRFVEALTFFGVKIMTRGTGKNMSIDPLINPNSAPNPP